MMIHKLKDLILSINAAIDSGKNTDISIDDISMAILNDNIFQFLKNEVQSPREFNFGYFSKTEKDHLIAQWQILINTNDFPSVFFVKNSGLCLLLALVTLSVQPNT